MALLNVPGEHSTCCVAPTVVGAKLPFMMALHLVCASWSWNVPAAHAGHGYASSPAMSEYEPGEHAVGVREPSAHVVPAGHCVQFDALGIPLTLLYVPVMHGTVLVAPSVQ